MAVKIASTVRARRGLANGSFIIRPQILRNTEFKDPPQNSLPGQPQDIFREITRMLNVNDQICLAMTSKSLAIAILNDRKLACNSSDQAVRFETWRFGWLPAYTQIPCSPQTLRPQDLILRSDIAKRLNVRRTMRCKRKARNDMMARLKARQRTAPLIEVKTSSGKRRRDSDSGDDSGCDELSLNLAL